MTLTTMIEYLRCTPSVLLADVTLLKMIATLLPNLAMRIIQTLNEIVDDLVADKTCHCECRGSAYSNLPRQTLMDVDEHEAVLEALNVFPLHGEL